MDKFTLFRQIETAPFEKGFLPSGEAALDRRHEKVVKAVPNEGAVLEVRPGDGKLGVYFLNRGQPYSMIDVSRKRLFSFYEHIGMDLSVPCFCFNDMWEWAVIPSDSYNSVIACDVIEHVSDYRAMVNEMIRISRHRVILTTPVGQSFFSEEHVHFFEEKDFEFIDKPYTIEQITTKASDEQSGQRCFYIEIDTRG